jgi:hypothetical protein
MEVTVFRDLFTRCLHRFRAGVKYKITKGDVILVGNQVMMFNTELSCGGHSRRFVLGHLPLGGWELLIEEDHSVVSRILYTDWHRVERALEAITRRVSELEAHGWRALSESAPQID